MKSNNISFFYAMFSICEVMTIIDKQIINNQNIEEREGRYNNNDNKNDTSELKIKELNKSWTEWCQAHTH